MKKKLGYMTIAIIAMYILVCKIIEYPDASLKSLLGGAGVILIFLIYGLIITKMRKIK